MRVVVCKTDVRGTGSRWSSAIMRERDTFVLDFWLCNRDVLTLIEWHVRPVAWKRNLVGLRAGFDEKNCIWRKSGVSSRSTTTSSILTSPFLFICSSLFIFLSEALFCLKRTASQNRKFDERQIEISYIVCYENCRLIVNNLSLLRIYLCGSPEYVFGDTSGWI